MSRIKIAKFAGMKLVDVVKKLRKRKYAKDSKKNQERARGVKTNKSVKAYNIRAKDAETKIIPVKRQSQKGSTFQTHRVRTKMGRAAAQSEEKGRLPSPLPTLDSLFKGSVQRGKLDDYRLTKMYLKNKLSDVAKKKFKGGIMMRKNMYLTGGQAKLDKNKNNKIDAQDFAILRKEKAKGRGKGLQDEKMKPGKVKPVKAVLGLAAMGVLGAKFLKDKKKKASKMPGAAGAGIMPGETVAELYKKKMQGKVAGGAIGAMGSGLGKSARDRALKSVKSSIDIIGAANRDRGKDKARQKKKNAAGRPMTRAMMGGGMMMAPRGAMGAMGGGMATPMGYKKGRSVKVKCKLGRNKPTKMY